MIVFKIFTPFDEFPKISLVIIGKFVLFFFQVRGVDNLFLFKKLNVDILFSHILIVFLSEIKASQLNAFNLFLISLKIIKSKSVRGIKRLIFFFFTKLTIEFIYFFYYGIFGVMCV